MPALILLCVIAVIALVTVSVANHRETRRKLIKLKLKKMKVRLDELEEVLTELELMLESRAIPRFVNQHIIRHIESMLQLDKEAVYLNAALENAEKRAVFLADESSTKAINRMRSSDAKIAKAKHALEEAGKILHALYARGSLDKAEQETFTHELSWAYLMVDIVSLISEGHKAASVNATRSHAFYNSAKNILVASKNVDPRKNVLIRQVTDIMLKRRSSLSTDLMPETEFNPDEKEQTSTQP